MKQLRKKYKPALWTTMANAKLRPSQSQKRKILLRKYARDARAFITEALTNPATQWCVIAALELKQAARVTQVHHFAGRQGPLLLWKKGWLPVSDIGHNWLHSHIKEARERGWIAGPGDWNNPKIIERYQ